ncbi:hypothetical protein [Microbacterium sp. J1-1]|uniref:hypothetical protein n=1 Tax=Microbacterium sp. J1-1 TaxID=2992441 RepID=UPI0021157B15|nr:hypothetical protein [Microbacterium sp. J1-1]UUE19350.1 hypothetical protein LRQ07_11065 [Microbacterium sp. J1-1]
MNTPTIDDVAQTLAEYERLAIGTGVTVQILPTLFSADFETWRPVWDGDTPPAYAHARVLRDGVLTERYVVWAESLPAEDSWRALWLAKPTKLFGAYADRSVLRRAFRDAIGDRREPDEQNAQPPASDARDWDAEILATNTPDAVNALHAQMKRARAVTVAREVALQEHLLEVATLAWEPESVEQNVAGSGVRRAPQTPAPAAPRDHLPPANRAARRANARKKGRKG